MSAIDNFANLFSAGTNAANSVQNDVKETKDAVIAAGSVVIVLQMLSTAAAVTMAVIAIKNYERSTKRGN